jgi:PAS domain S-box-containing protein
MKGGGKIEPPKATAALLSRLGWEDREIHAKLHCVPAPRPLYARRDPSVLRVSPVLGPPLLALLAIFAIQCWQVRRGLGSSGTTITAALALAGAAWAGGAGARLRGFSLSYRRAVCAQMHLRRLWEANIIGVVYSDAAGNILDANDALLRMIGYTRADLEAGRIRWRDITPPEYLPLDARGIAEARESGACTPYEKVYVGKDGRPVSVLIGYALVEGSRAEFLCFVVDLSERVRVDAERYELTRVIAENAAAALFVQDERGYCTFMNPAAEAMTGYSFAEIGARPLHDLIHHLRPDGSPYPIEECPIYAHYSQPGHERLHHYEDVFVRKNGERFPVVFTLSPVLRDGRRVSSVLEVRDISWQKRIEEEREQLLDSERAARSAAERATRAKDELLATLSHELRTPLNAILGWASMLQKGTLDAAATERGLAVIERNARAEAQLVEDLLDVSRIAAGKMRIDVRRVTPTDVVDAAVDSVRFAAEAKQIRLAADLDRQAGEVMADAGRLQQVVWNMLTNAIKFTPKGGRVRVSLRRADAQVEIAVRDTGQGIAPDFLPYVFERFRQADSSTTRRHTGLGLGLALVKQLVEMHGGTVRAESEGVGHGATFTVTLPVAPPCWHGAEALAAARASLRGVRVLVVDDEEDTRELVQRLLAECQAEVVAVESAPAALDAVERFHPDVLLSDIGMPQQDGYQLVRTLRERDAEHGGRTPAAALTAFARPEDRDRALRAGYQMHVAKPVEANELIAVVADLAGRADGHRHAAPR